jgi:hypothetical protein
MLGIRRHIVLEYFTDSCSPAYRWRIRRDAAEIDCSPTTFSYRFRRLPPTHIVVRFRHKRSAADYSATSSPYFLEEYWFRAMPLDFLARYSLAAPVTASRRSDFLTTVSTILHAINQYSLVPRANTSLVYHQFIPPQRRRELITPANFRLATLNAARASYDWHAQMPLHRHYAWFHLSILWVILTLPAAPSAEWQYI